MSQVFIKRFVSRIANRLVNGAESWRAQQLKTSLGSCGENVYIGPRTRITSPENVFVGHDVSLGVGGWLSAVNASIQIGNYVMFGPEVALICGNHNTAEVGIPMFSVKAKRPGDDLPIVIEDEVWLGFRTTILKGVTVGRGAVVGANSVVNRDVPPYAIVVGNPARVQRFRFDLETIMRHEESIYPPEKRLAVVQLERGGVPHQSEVEGMSEWSR